MEENKDDMKQKKLPQDVPKILNHITTHFYTPKTTLQKIIWFLKCLKPVSFGTVNRAVEGLFYAMQKEAEERVESDTVMVTELNKCSLVLSKLVSPTGTEKDEDDPAFR